MTQFIHTFEFDEDDHSQIHGHLELDEPLPFLDNESNAGFYRPGKIMIEGSNCLEIVLYHTLATSAFIYLRNGSVDANQLQTIGLSEPEIAKIQSLYLPGQLCMGANRSRLTRQAIFDMFGSPCLKETISQFKQQNLAIFPIAREGLKYQVLEAIFENYGYYCDEIVLDAHHVFDSSVPVYNRKVEMTLFKDKDLDREQRENISVAFLADSIASGMVMKEVISRVKERFDHIQRVEVIAPLATVRGLCRVARSECAQNIQVRLHAFETLLNALPPDYYYSAHYPDPRFHICPDLEEKYRAWWGKDAAGHDIADTACAGYGWSEVFYSPRKQIQMINSELGSRHDLSIADIVRRNIH
jgi:hypothetical protein